MTPAIGNAAPRAAFAAAMAGGALHHAWLITGPEGTGKAGFAHDMARRMLAHAADPSLDPTAAVPAGHRIGALLDAGSHPDFRLLARLPKDAEKPDQDVARSITIAQVRTLQPMFATKPSMSSRRVVLIDSIDDLERGGANALLKNLEEPPAGTIFLLVSHAPGRLLPTIRSRCRLLRFAALEDAEVAAVLRHELPEAGDDEIAVLVRAGAGSPGRALRFAGLDMASIERDLTLLADRGDADNAIRSRLAKALGVKAAHPRYVAFLERVPAFLAERARLLQGSALRDALDAHAAAKEVAGAAIGLSQDAGAAVFEIGGIVARLAR
ncbi:DNA polymerase III subunit delta' [Sphingomonas sp. S1-29]|uniref:AAA family ATPase n=1 Tax=Sphingomonas sp. S1-29 TaxID=2991074 RepID=UPI00224076DA|nr:AAA family ATPase [Sphingomonas sp. S1-29]UZK70004.1 DNA polymerase III subunit delta' [Sphingomonas sp. S1-29]